MAVLLALCAAVAYGLSDFLGGVLSRRTSAWSVAVLGQSSGALCIALVALTVTGHPSGKDFGWALLAGLGSGLGTGFLYRGFSAGRMSVVAPVSAVGAALVPVAVGTVTGERLSLPVWAGVVVALPGIWLVSSSPEPATAHGGPPGRLREGLLDGVLAGLGFGLLFAALGQVPDSAGLWPLAVCQLVGVPVVALLATAVRAPWVPRGRTVRWAVLAGALGATATATFLLASQQGHLSVAGVLTSLYPAGTVLLAALVLREHVHRTQGVGLLLCGLAVGLVAAG